MLTGKSDNSKKSLNQRTVLVCRAFGGWNMHADWHRLLCQADARRVGHRVTARDRRHAIIPI
jgi:hypothetical protein